MYLMKFDIYEMSNYMFIETRVLVNY